MAKWANEGLHGGIEVDYKPHVWDDTMDGTVRKFSASADCGNGE